MADTIPELMGIFEAARWGKRRYNIRLSTWVEDMATVVPGTTGKRVTAWLAYSRGLWFYRYLDESDVWQHRVVENTDVDADDLRRTDWTTRDENWQAVPEPPEIPPGEPVSAEPALPPIPPARIPGSSGDGGDGDGGGSGGGDGGGSGTGGTSGGGGGSGSGGGGGGGNRRRPRPDRAKPTINVTVSRTSGDDCIVPIGGEPDITPITDSFTVEFELLDPDAEAGEVWFVSVQAQGIIFNGTMGSGDTDSAAFGSSLLPPGSKIPVVVNAWLPHVGISGQGFGEAAMRDHCDPADGGCTDSLATNYNPAATWDDGSCTYPPVMGCTNPAAFNFDPLATVDDGSCILSCPSGEHWDEGSQMCVPD